MNRLIKIIATIIALIVLIIIIGIVVLILFIDPNHFKPLIIKQVDQETGRHLTIPGKLSWSFFPTISITTGELSLSNPKGFDQPLFLHVNSAKAEVRLFPLITGEIVPKTLDLQGLQLHLIRNKSGVGNWQFSQSTPTTATPPQQTAKQHANNANINIPNIDVGNATISYMDKTTGQKIEVKQLNLQAQQAHLGRPFPLQFSSQFSTLRPKVTGNVTLNATVTLGPDQKKLTLSNLAFKANVSTKQTNFKAVPIQFNGDAILDTNTKSLHLKPMSGQVANLNYQGYLDIDQAKDSDVHYKGALNVTPFNLQTFLTTLGQPSIALQDASALQKVGFNATISGTNNAVSIGILKAAVDQAVLSGSIHLTDIKNLIGKFNLNLDHLNLDNYQLKEAQSKQITSKQANQKPTTLQYPDLLKRLQIAGMIHAKDLTVSKLHFEHLESQLVTNRGNININPLAGELYHGDLHASINVNIRPVEPTYHITADVKKINLSPLFKDLFNTPNAEGILNMHTRLDTLGNTDLALKQHLNGQAQINVKDAVIKNIDLDHYYKMGVAFLGGKTSNLGSGNNETNVGSLSALFNIDNGVAHNDDLTINSQEFSVSGNGMVNLVNNNIQYHLLVNDRKNTTIPLEITGTLQSPNVGLDKSALAAAVRHKAEKHIRGELKKKLNEHLGNLF